MKEKQKRNDDGDIPDSTRKVQDTAGICRIREDIINLRKQDMLVVLPPGEFSCVDQSSELEKIW